jgi:peptide deformylase
MSYPYVEPHINVSREVTKKDLETVIRDAKVMINLCSNPHGIHPSALAIAHPQINDTDPLRFFVTDSEIFINPRIIRHSNYEVTKKEGCMSFPDRSTMTVKRWHKIVVEYSLFSLEGQMDLLKVITQDFSGLQAEVFQHEIDHFDGKYIFEI